MDNPTLIAFITGLTAGGLSCFAVQGGLLSASIAQKLELEALENSRAARSKKGSRPAAPRYQSGMIQPILLFVLAKLLAYTILGFTLGWLGSFFTFSPVVQGIVQILVAVFLLGNGLRMLNVHPIFRYFSFEPPKAVTRYIRRTSKSGQGWITPLYLGALTVLIPCGVTQAMMAVAVGTGSPMMGALIMFAFVLGTSPTFIAVSWLATSIGGLFQRYFYKAVGVIILVMGLYGLNAGLTLVGSPVSASHITRLLSGDSSAVPQEQAGSSNPVPGTSNEENPTLSAQPAAALAGPTDTAAEPQPIDIPSGAAVVSPTIPVTEIEQPAVIGISVARIDVENGGYVPDLLTLPAGQEIELHLVTEQISSCSRAFVIPELNIMEILPETGDVVVSLPPQPAGKSMDFMCSMGMYTGVFKFQ